MGIVASLTTGIKPQFWTGCKSTTDSKKRKLITLSPSPQGPKANGASFKLIITSWIAPSQVRSSQCLMAYCFLVSSMSDPVPDLSWEGANARQPKWRSKINTLVQNSWVEVSKDKAWKVLFETQGWRFREWGMEISLQNSGLQVSLHEAGKLSKTQGWKFPNMGSGSFSTALRLGNLLHDSGLPVWTASKTSGN